MRKGASIIRGVLVRAVVVAAVAGSILGIAAAGALASPADQSGAYQVDATHDGSIADAGLAAPLTQAWSVTLPNEVSYPLIVNGTVFVIANNTLYALSQATGSTSWSRGVGSAVGLSYDRGRIFVVSSSGLLTAIDPGSGSIDWSKQMPGQSSFSSAPTAANGIVYTGGAGSGGTVYAARENDGTLLWTGSVENGDSSSPAVDAQGVYVSYACQQAYAFDPVAGTLLWHHDSACEGGGGATTAVADGTVFARDGVLGDIMLSASTGSEIGPFDAGPTPAVANDVAFMLSGSGSTLSAVKNAGQGVNAWQFTGDSHLDTAPIVANGLVFIGSSQGNLYALDAATGATSWSTNIGAGVSAADQFSGLGAANGTLIVPAGDQLFAYRTSGSITSAPANNSLPTIDGKPEPGQLLAADVGIWSGQPTGYTYQWELCDGAGANCADINGATDFTYTPPADDVGSTLRVKVVATNDNGSSAPVESAASAALSGGPPANKTLPTIDGTAQQDGVLTADPGTWSGNPTSFSYQWRSCTTTSPASCSDIVGETDSVYFPTAADVGNRLVVRVIATNGDGDSAPADSAQTDPVLPPPPENGFPTISGSAVVGKTLTADPGQWDGNPTSFTYQWFSCDTNFNDCPFITGASASNQTYVVQAADEGRLIGVEVVATNQYGPSFPADSDVVGPVTGPPANLTSPAIAGTAEQGDTLTVSQGTWAGNPTKFTFQWYSCDDALSSCSVIPAAFGSSYQVGAGDVGRRLLAGVVASNSSGNSLEKRSNATDPVLTAAPSLQAAPTISGAAEVGRTLTAHPGSWTNSPTSYQYDWERCNASGSGCTSITGAVGASHKLAGSDVGKRLFVEVVAVNAGGRSAPADSNDSFVVKAAAKCHVPNVVGMKLAAAKAKIQARECSVGHITRKASGAAKKGRVVSQSPKSGRTLADRGKIDLGVGKG